MRSIAWPTSEQSPASSFWGMQAPPLRQVLRIRTDGYANYSLAYSPFFQQTLAVASAANFGLVGNGRLHLCNVSKGGLVDKR